MSNNDKNCDTVKESYFVFLKNIINDSFKTVFQIFSININLVIFLCLFSILLPSLIYCTNPTAKILIFITIFISIGAFLSGWTQVIKEAIKKDDNPESKNYFAIFLEGIGKNIAPVFVAELIYIAFFVVLFLISCKLSTLLFGNIDFLLNDINQIAQSNESFFQYMKGLSQEQLFTIYGWNFVFLVMGALLNFIFIFYLPALVDSKCENNHFKALKEFGSSIKFLFKNFFGVLFLCILINLTGAIFGFIKQLFLSINTTNEAISTIVSFIFFIFSIYFLSLTVVIIFNYYEQKNNCADGCDGIGENDSCNTAC